MLLQEIWEKVKAENARSKEKHGMWRDTPHFMQFNAVYGEFKEFQEAFYSGDVDGEHGQVNELIDLINVCCRRIQHLTGEPDA